MSRNHQFACVTKLSSFSWLVALLFVFGVTVVPAIAQPGRTQSQPGAGTRSGYTLYGDLKIDESQSPDHKAMIYDVILYSRGHDVVARQRLSNGGRYRFVNLFNGDYYLAIESEGQELARTPVMITGQPGDDMRQDIELEMRATGSSRSAPAVVAVGGYDRPKQTRPLYEKSTKQIQAKDFPGAITTLREIVSNDPADYNAWSDLGMVYFVQKDLENAESSYAGAVKAKPDYVDALVNLGRVQLARKTPEKAVETLEAAVKADPNSAAANFFLGEAYLQLKKGSKAVGFLNQAIKLDPVGMADAHLRLASLYTAAGYKDRAAAEYEEFLKQKPDYPDRKKLEEFIQANKPKAP